MNINSSMDDNVVFPEPVALLHTGHPGRPKKIIDVEFLVEAVSNSRQIKLTELAEMLGVHRNMLRLYMKHHGVTKENTPSSPTSIWIFSSPSSRKTNLIQV